MAPKVYYAPFDGEADAEHLSARARDALSAAGLREVVVPDQPCGVKTHFGEKGNTSYLPPSLLRTVVDEVAAGGAKPCLIETSTLYLGQRSNAVDHFNLAVDHGFGPQATGCPLIFVDGLRGNMHVERPMQLDHFETVAVPADLTLMPSLVVCSHVTGHVMAGYGGAIKNVAMGLASRAGKLRQHSSVRPQVREQTCIACRTCTRWCPVDAITVDEVAEIDYEKCIGCGECVAVCPVGAVSFDWGESAGSFNERMAEYARGILDDKLDRILLLNVIWRVTKDCNCMGDTGGPACRDLGVLVSRDAVAVDQATVDLVNSEHGGDLFEELNPGLQYTTQFTHGEAVGLGSCDYDLVTV